jgi:hypothetical protein
VRSGRRAGEDPRVQAAAPATGEDRAAPEATPAPAAPRPTVGRGVRLVAWTVVTVTVLAAIGAAVLDAVTPAAAREAAHASPGWMFGLPGFGLAVPAALLLHRAPRNAVSWVVGATGLLWAVDGLAQSWLTYAV